MARRFSANVKPYKDFFKGKVIGLARGKKREAAGAEAGFKGTQVPYTFATFGQIKFLRRLK